MSIAAKILIIANLLVAAVFGYLAITDWGKRQAWAYDAYRYDVVAQGLPVDADETDVNGTKLVDKLSDNTMREIFKPVGGLEGSRLTPKDKTQMAEVERFHQKVRAQLDGIADEDAKRDVLAFRLVPTARTLDERRELQRDIRQKPIAELMSNEGALESAFAAVLRGKTSDNKERGRESQRRAIAHLLVNMSPDEASRQRAAAVVGLQAFCDEANSQSFAYGQMAERMTVTQADRREDFLADQARIVGDLQLLGQDIEERRSELTRQQALLARHKQLAGARESNLKDLRKDLDDARKKTKDELDKLTRENKLLFDADQQVGKRNETNQALERQIRAAEHLNP